MASADILRAARARIEDPKNWTQEAFARRANGDRTTSSSSDAVCWCAVGALNAEEIYGDYGSGRHAFELISNCAAKLYGERDISVINDGIGHAAVLKCFDLAIAAAEAEAGR